MHALAVLDLSYNLDLVKLPEAIGKLINLCYLNLSNTRIGQLPTGITYLKNLKILRLDGMRYLAFVPCQVISSLSSLQVFSWFSTELVELHYVDSTSVLAELESLENIHDISVTLCNVDAVNRVKSSPKLQSCIKRLAVVLMASFLLPLDLRMDHLETLEIDRCSLESKNDYFGDQGRTRTYCFRNLRHLSVKTCPCMTDLKWIRYAPNLQFLYVSYCPRLSEIIGTYESPGTSEIEESQDFFSNLMVIDLRHLPSLTSICCGVVPFPSLQTISVNGCPSLRKLPLNSGSAKNSLNAIRGSREWWDRLEWEDEDTRNVFASKFLEL
ncbi:hypothetical protein CISIN_1g048462mg [Citrus sinensis]|uniref:Disease resistance R13L4/SHOC-2-like LRR domain-containing protein n=1 Tax=Citrus sinensis TaxID=2711 RepID=A0A067D2F7_CITSI|nr:hypothetical protein CISIN_1g048462mg [Citrus sinensis]